jgi:glycosyltransferase involved in cell wall biosynthesis
MHAHNNVIPPPANITATADSIRVFFPCYNEQDNIRQSYESASIVLKRLELDYEIILVDDGSTDQIPHIADPIAVADPHITAFITRRILAMRRRFKLAPVQLSRRWYFCKRHV